LYVPVGPDSLVNLNPGNDWLINPLTGLHFDHEVIGPSGRTEMIVLTSLEVSGTVPQDGMLANIHIGSDLPMGSVAVVPSALFGQAGMTKVAGSLNVVGGAGFSTALAQNLDALSRAR
jgi:hypothetical protein